MLAAASRSAPTAGAANPASVAIVLAARFAAVSSSGVRASDGRMAACAGRKAVEASVTIPART